MKEIIRQKKEAYNKMFGNQSQENKVKYKNIKYLAKKVVANSILKKLRKS